MNEDQIIIELVSSWLEGPEGATYARIRYAEFTGALQHTLEAGLRNAEIRKRLREPERKD
jgi:hypothetical protein